MSARRPLVRVDSGRYRLSTAHGVYLLSNRDLVNGHALQGWTAYAVTPNGDIRHNAVAHAPTLRDLKESL